MVTDPLDAELKEARDEMLRKIGRNMLLFQDMEYKLKFILANHKIHAPISKLKETFEQQNRLIYKHTLGMLAGQYLDKVLNIKLVDSDDNSHEELTEPYFTFCFNIEANDVDVQKITFNSLIKSRNELIHELIPHINMSLVESCMSCNDRLDQQREKILPFIERLGNIINALKESYKEFEQKLITGEIDVDVVILRSNALVSFLYELSEQSADAAGWVDLREAGRKIQQLKREDWSVLMRRYNIKTLKELLVKTSIFDIFELKNNKTSGTYLWYRVSVSDESSPYFKIIPGAAEDIMKRLAQ